LATQKIKETEKGKYIVNLNVEGTLAGQSILINPETHM
jgi:ribonuclease R